MRNRLQASVERIENHLADAADVTVYLSWCNDLKRCMDEAERLDRLTERWLVRLGLDHGIKKG